jgi:hypothetical protein
MLGGTAAGLPEAAIGYASIAAMGVYATYIAPAIFRALGLMKQPQAMP